MKRIETDNQEVVEQIGYDFGLKRRSFVQLLGAGLLFTASAAGLAQQRGGRRGGEGGPKTIGARIHIGADGRITVLAGKVEGGQGARAEVTEAAAEELRVDPSIVSVVLGDTGQSPNDGITAGSGTTPRTIPSVRQGAAAAREALTELAAKGWAVAPAECEVRQGKIQHPATKRSITYAQLAAGSDFANSLQQAMPGEITLTPVKEWKVLGKAQLRPNGREIVTGSHDYPSDCKRPGMGYGKVLRAPAFGAKLISVDLEPARKLEGVAVVQDEQFVGVVAPTAARAEEALALLAKNAKWEKGQGISSQDLYSHLSQHAQGGVPANPFPEDVAAAKKVIRQTYQIAYVQHAPLEPRAAVAEWKDGKLTVWTGTQNPFGCRSELARAFHAREEDVRVIVPDFGAGFGGKHTGETGVEAARLAKGAGKPVSLRWTREEEFTFAYFRPAGVVQAEATLDDKGSIATWHFININSGASGVETPYRIARHRSQYVASSPPLRHGSYRALAATANHFARESFMDELALAAGQDPLGFRRKHLENARLRAVLDAAAERFRWQERMKEKTPNRGFGIACGTEKRSFVAACVEVEVNGKEIRVRRICEAFECGAVLNPVNLRNQVQGGIIMALGPALREEMRFENGEILNPSFRGCPVPRFDDVPELDIVLLDRPDLSSEGAGETPLIPIAPAIANAVFHATGKRLRAMPLKV